MLCGIDNTFSGRAQRDQWPARRADLHGAHGSVSGIEYHVPYDYVFRQLTFNLGVRQYACGYMLCRPIVIT